MEAGELDEGGQKVQISNYETNPWEIMYNMINIIHPGVHYIWKLLRE